jgi:hypothetical protein
MRQHNRGRLPWNTGKKFPLWLRKKLSIAHGGDGTFTNPYGIEFNNELKRSIFERDNFRCKTCGKNHSIVCHHIDKNKQNNNPDNLITLCRSCHSKIHEYQNRLRARGY